MFKRLLLALLFLTTAAHAATPTLIQNSNGHSTTTSCVVTLNSVVATHTLVFVIATNTASVTINSILDSSGNTVSPAVAYSQRIGIYYVASASSGTHTITVSFASAVTCELFLSEYSNVATASPLDVGGTITTATSSAVTTNAITTTVNGDLVIFGFGASGGGTSLSSYTSSFVQNDSYIVSGGPSSAWASVVQGTAGAISTSATGSQSSTWATALASFKASAGGGSCTDAGITSAGAFSVPNGSSGSYRLQNGSYGTPDCSTVSYKDSGGAFVVN